MPVIQKNKSIFEPKPQLIPLKSTNGGKYIANTLEPLENENRAEIPSIYEQLENALKAKDQAIAFNATLENQLSRANEEIKSLNEEINQLKKEKRETEELYQKTLKENRDLKEFTKMLMDLAYLLCNKVLGL